MRLVLVDRHEVPKSAAWEVMEECLNEQNTIFIQWLQQVKDVG